MEADGSDGGANASESGLEQALKAPDDSGRTLPLGKFYLNELIATLGGNGGSTAGTLVAHAFSEDPALLSGAGMIGDYVAGIGAFYGAYHLMNRTNGHGVNSRNFLKLAAKVKLPASIAYFTVRGAASFWLNKQGVEPQLANQISFWAANVGYYALITGLFHYTDSHSHYRNSNYIPE